MLVSGWGFQPEDAAQARGVDRVMAKPFSFQDVERALRALFDSNGQRRRLNPFSRSRWTNALGARAGALPVGDARTLTRVTRPRP